MSLNAIQENQALELDPSLGWETNGVLARPTQQGALFNLFLAMHQHGQAEPTAYESHSTNAHSKTTHSKNYYRRSSTCAENADWHKMQITCELLHRNCDDARLFLSIHPPPLSQKDDVQRLPDDVINNCSLAAQKRIKGRLTNTISEDNTLLFELIDEIRS